MDICENERRKTERLEKQKQKQINYTVCQHSGAKSLIDTIYL